MSDQRQNTPPPPVALAAEAPRAENELSEEEFHRWYGPWRALSPVEVRELLEGCGFSWWVAGGWALEAAGAASRHHEDTDIVVLRRDLPAIRAWLSAFHLWQADSGALRPLLPAREMPDESHQLWMRKDSSGPWLLDLLVSPSEGDDWISRRHDRIRRPLDDVGWIGPDDVPYLKPEIVLLFKAKNTRPKDAQDFDSLKDRLDPSALSFLRDSLSMAHPEHAWLGVFG
ncbi:MAG TPA: hypothetical protein VGP46_06200 [Acidimicrobiales bacterium]|jgi:hypothetical protein|nr:hypothetical protein [Acidimicrobiales bacterium]